MLVAGWAPAPRNWNDTTGGLAEKVAVHKQEWHRNDAETMKEE